MQKPDWHCIGALEAQQCGDRRADLHRARADLVDPDEGFLGICLRRSAGDRRQPRQRQPGRHGLAGRRRRDGAQLLLSCLGRCLCACRATGTATTTKTCCGRAATCRTFSIENSVLSTSISNIVRAGWPRKIFNSRNFTLRDSDILHGGIGACGQTFGLLGFWGANGAKGDHSNYTFENLFLDDWYSLVQIEQEQPAVHGFTFRNIWALDQPPLDDLDDHRQGGRRDLRQREVRADAGRQRC